MREYSYDRREGAVAVLVDDEGESVTVLVSDLPSDAQEGDRLTKTKAGFTVEKEATADARRRALELQQRLRR